MKANFFKSMVKKTQAQNINTKNETKRDKKGRTNDKGLRRKRAKKINNKEKKFNQREKKPKVDQRK
jgi:hypothetical protein